MNIIRWDPSEASFLKHLDTDDGILSRWELPIKEMIPVFNPATYTSTTGCALRKMELMVKDLQQKLNTAIKIRNKLQKLKDKGSTYAKSGFVETDYLETDWVENGVFIFRKVSKRPNPYTHIEGDRDYFKPKRLDKK